MSKARQAETETVERVKPGSSIPAQAKELVVNLFGEMTGTINVEGVETVSVSIAADTYQWLNELVESITANTSRGLAPEVQLEKAEAERNWFYVNSEVVDGVAVFPDNPKVEGETGKQAVKRLSTKIDNLERKIAKAKESSETQTDDEGEAGSENETADE